MNNLSRYHAQAMSETNQTYDTLKASVDAHFKQLIKHSAAQEQNR